MKPNYSCFLWCIVTSFTIHSTIFAQTDKKEVSPLSIGDNAPELKIDKWLKGGNFVPLEKGKVYLIDFWATWCVPCIAGMPHLSMLQAKYKSKGFEIIGVTNEDKFGNSLEKVQAFIKRKDTAMNYSVAWAPVSKKDSLQGIWLHPWMQQAGFENLPTAFLIDRMGKLVFMGEPLSIDSTLDAVINNRYDINSLKNDYEQGVKAEEVLSKFNAAIKASKIKEAVEYGRQILTNFNYVKPNTYLILGWQVSHITGEIDPGLLEIGSEAAIRAVKMTHFESPGFLDVLAAMYAAKKDYFNAIITEKLAISLSEGGMKENQLKNLQKYLSLSLEK